MVLFIETLKRYATKTGLFFLSSGTHSFLSFRASLDLPQDQSFPLAEEQVDFHHYHSLEYYLSLVHAPKNLQNNFENYLKK